MTRIEVELLRVPSGSRYRSVVLEFVTPLAEAEAEAKAFAELVA